MRNAAGEMWICSGNRKGGKSWQVRIRIAGEIGDRGYTWRTGSDDFRMRDSVPGNDSSTFPDALDRRWQGFRCLCWQYLLPFKAFYPVHALCHLSSLAYALFCLDALHKWPSCYRPLPALPVLSCLPRVGVQATGRRCPPRSKDRRPHRRPAGLFPPIFPSVRSQEMLRTTPGDSPTTCSPVVGWNFTPRPRTACGNGGGDGGPAKRSDARLSS